MKKQVQTQTTRKTLIKRVILLAVVFLLAAAAAFPPGADWAVDRINQAAGTKFPYIHFPLVLGLDLQGGTHLEYTADLSKITEAEKGDAMNGVRDVIERRVNAMGVSEPLVQITKAGNDWRLSVELAGIRDIQQAIKMIGETPILDFREPATDADKTLTDEQRKEINEFNAELKTKAEAAFKQAQAGTSLEEIAKQESSDKTSAEKGGDLGFILDQTGYQGLRASLLLTKAGELYPGVIDDGGTYYVAQVLERKDAGKEVRASQLLIQFAGAQESSSTSTKEQALAKIQDIAARTTPENYDAGSGSTHRNLPITLGDLDWFHKGVMVPHLKTRFRSADRQDCCRGGNAVRFPSIKKTGERPVEDI